MQRDVSTLIQPKTVAIVGASARRRTQGNGVIQHLLNANFAGRIIPVHNTAAEIDGLPTAGAIDQLPRGIDCAGSTHELSPECMPASSMCSMTPMMMA